jgi:urea transporter/murein DD-endopeptidase MepM/ murein hydrolase activator NlpD
VTQILNATKNLGFSVINSYSSILFSEKRLVGVLILLSTLIEPLTGITGILGALIALLFARILNFEEWSSQTGILGFNSMLVCLGIGFFMPNALFWSPTYWLILGGSSVITFLLFITLNYLTTTYLNMPSMSISFSIVAILFSFFIMRIGEVATVQDRFAFFSNEGIDLNIGSYYLQSLGSIFFSPYIISGILVVIALILTSRIGFLLSLMGFGISYYLVSIFNTDYLETLGLYQISYTAFNLMLIAISMGGVFLIPSLTSYIIAAFACVIGFIITYAFQFLFENYYVAPFAFPMNITVIVLVIALRLRLQNKHPNMANFGIFVPEDNLKYYYSKIKRFYQAGGLQFYLPFVGEWTITQGNHGEITHKLQWAYAWDFEITNKEGLTYRGDGSQTQDYFCYGKPVLASANGWVVNFVDGIDDNPIGQINTRENWGNFVVVNHGIGIYSMYCHIKKGTIKVKNGEWIAKGDKLGLVGNSGRSAVPHLHFNVQRGAAPGSQTIKSHLLNYKHRDNGLSFKAFGIPKKGDIISALMPVNYLQDMLHLKVEDTSTFRVKCGNQEFIEKWSVEVDLYGRFFIKSDQKCTLEFSVYDGIFNVLDYKGKANSALHTLAILMSRLPLYKEEDGLVWNDLPPYSIILKPIAENSLMLLQSIVNISSIKSNSSVKVTDKTIHVATNTVLNILGKQIKSYSGNIEIEDLVGFTKMELQLNGKELMKVELVEE